MRIALLVVAGFLLAMAAPGAPRLVVTEVAPAKLERRGAGYFADFGADVFGNLRVTFPDDIPAGTVIVRLGEKLDAAGAIDHRPGGSINTVETTLVIRPGRRVYELTIPPKQRHEDPAAVRPPAEIGEITPFRYVEIEGSPAPLTAVGLRQLFVHAAFDDHASAFESSDETLNAVWRLCKHTMKATTAFGVYIDGERERIPYEADAYINLLSHLANDANPEVARHTIGHLLRNPTWPTEWGLQMPMMAAAEYEATGDPALAAANYDALKRKLPLDRARADGLLEAGAIVDWPAVERDGYNGGGKADGDERQVGPMINTVANAFYYRALRDMAGLARALGKSAAARLFEAKAAQVGRAFNAVFFDPAQGLYIDGEGSGHASLHANMFPLAFDLVPEARRRKVADFVASRGMACSVYGAQFLLEALYKSNEAAAAFRLMTSHGQRSWWNMIRAGSTMTLEAWDIAFKPNLTWNHAWGSAPANIIARYLVGVRPLDPGYKKILIAPQPEGLTWFKAKVPTVRGPVIVTFRGGPVFFYGVEVPPGATAELRLPGPTGIIRKEKAAEGRHAFEVR